MSDRLFDVELLTAPGCVPRDEKPPPAKPATSIETVSVRANRDWRIVTTAQPGAVHAVKSGPDLHGGFMAWCGIKSGARTFDEGQIVQGCRKCLDMGASRRDVVA